MARNSYEITETIGGFEEGEILDVTARFGDWHTYELKLESRATGRRSNTVVVTEHKAGFSEAEILDETARIGDWHELELSFEPVSGSGADGRRVEITADELREIADPVES